MAKKNEAPEIVETKPFDIDEALTETPKNKKTPKEEVKKMFYVLWSQPKILNIGGPDRGAPIIAQIYPGMNKVDETVIHKLKTHPFLQHHIKEEDLQIISDGELDFDSMTKKQCEKIVGMTLNVEELEKLVKHNRVEVSETAKKTLAKLLEK